VVLAAAARFAFRHAAFEVSAAGAGAVAEAFLVRSRRSSCLPLCLPALLLPPLAFREKTPMVTNWGTLQPSRKQCYSRSNAIRARRTMVPVRAELLQPRLGRVQRRERPPSGYMRI